MTVAPIYPVSFCARRLDTVQVSRYTYNMSLIVWVLWDISYWLAFVATGVLTCILAAHADPRWGGYAFATVAWLAAATKFNE